MQYKLNSLEIASVGWWGVSAAPGTSSQAWQSLISIPGNHKGEGENQFLRAALCVWAHTLTRTQTHRHFAMHTHRHKPVHMQKG